MEKKFDEIVFEMAAKEELTMPEAVDKKLKDLCGNLPVKAKGVRMKGGIYFAVAFSFAACALFTGTAFYRNQHVKTDITRDVQETPEISISTQSAAVYQASKEDIVETTIMTSNENDEFSQGLLAIRDLVVTYSDYYAPAQEGDPVYSVCAGTITEAGWKTGYGYCVTIRDESGWVWLYGHCSEILAKEGDEVVMGDLIARAGNTGVTTESVIRVKIVSKPRMHPVTKEIIDWPERGFANEESWDLYLQGVYGVGEDEIGD